MKQNPNALKKGRVITDRNGRSYTLIERIGSGGQAVVWKVKDNTDDTLYAYKYYKNNRMNVRQNIEDLIAIGSFKDRDGNVLHEVILPKVIVDGENTAFGYIMELVDLKGFTTILKAWAGEYPDSRILCRIVQNFAHVFETLHLSYGMCYKDVNEGNIFFNVHTGEIRIIDNDNIGYSSKFTIKGTNRYIAPEVYLGHNPDHNSDRFSLAVFVLRLLTGAYPFDGPRSEAYCLNHNMLEKDAAPVIYGTEAVFIWHPTDLSNSIASVKTPRAKGQNMFWKRLPEELKQLFISTFVTNLSEDRRAERPTDADWTRTFQTLEQTIVTCPHCKTETFSGAGVCFECGRKLAKRKPKRPPVQPPAPMPAPAKKHSVTVKILSAGEAKKETVLYVSDTRTGTDISRNLTSDTLFKILYNKKEKKVGIRNLSSASWTIVHPDRTRSECMPGQVEVLEKGMMIRIIPKTAQLNVLDVL